MVGLRSQRLFGKLFETNVKGKVEERFCPTSAFHNIRSAN